MANISRDRLRKIISENTRRETMNDQNNGRRPILESRLLVERKNLLNSFTLAQSFERVLERANAKITSNMIVNEGIWDSIKTFARNIGKGVSAPKDSTDDFAAGSETSDELLANKKGSSFQEEVNDLKKDIKDAESAYSRIRVNVRGLLLSPEVKESDFESILNFTTKIAQVQSGQFKLLSLMKSFDEDPDKSASFDASEKYKGVKGKINKQVFLDLKPHIDDAASIVGTALDMLKKIMDEVRSEIEKIKSTIEKNAKEIAKYVGEFEEDINDTLRSAGQKFGSGVAGDYGGTGGEGKVSRTRRERWGYGDDAAKKSYPVRK